MRNLNLSTGAAAFLTALEAKQARQVWNKIVALMKDPRPNDSIQLGEGYFRTTSGEFRIVYKFDDTTLFTDLVAKRNDDDVYKRLKRR